MTKAHSGPRAKLLPQMHTVTAFFTLSVSTALWEYIQANIVSPLPAITPYFCAIVVTHCPVYTIQLAQTQTHTCSMFNTKSSL